MPDIFLSYARDDQATARLFAEELQREGFSVWWDQALAAGEAFDSVIERALDGAKAVVVLWSRSSVESRWVRAEATQGHARQCLVPVTIEPCRRPIIFELMHTAELTGWSGDAADPSWRSFVDGLRRLVAKGGTGDTRGVAATHSSPPLARWRYWHRRRYGVATTAAIAAAAAIFGGVAVWRGIERATPALLSQPIHVAMAFEGRPTGWPFGTRHLDVSRDGARIVVEAGERVWIRSLGSALPVSAQLQCMNPFFSPDAAWVGCFSETAGLVKLAAGGGAAVPVAGTSDRPAGAVWGDDEEIYFATSAGLFRVADTGGDPELLLRPDPQRGERLLAWPELLPGGRALLLTILPSSPDAPNRIAMLDLRTRSVREVLTGGGSARYAASTGHLIYSTGQALRAVRFDPASGATRGEHVTLSNLDVAMSQDNGAAEFAISGNGTLAFLRPAPAAGSNTVLQWVDRNGRETPIPLPPANYRYPRVSPDGMRLALDLNPTGSNRDVWLVDLQRAALSRFTTETSEENLPRWSVDGSRIYFASNRGGDFDLYSRAADGSSETRLEVGGPGTQILDSSTPDGRKLIATQNFTSIVAGDLETHRFEPLLQGDSRYWLSSVSPDGRWIAYESNESGDKMDVYVRPYPDVSAGREKVSTDGGRYPLWAPAGGGRLFFVNSNGEMMEARLQFEPGLRVGEIHKLFDWNKPPDAISGRPFDVSPTDERFIMSRQVAAATLTSTEISVVLNWFDELRQQVP